METGRGRSDRARSLREHSLITLSVGGIALPSDVRRQRHRAVRINIDVFIQHNDSLAFRRNFFDPQLDVVDLRRRTDSHFPAGLHPTFPAPCSELFQKQELDRAVIRKSTRGENAGIIENQKVARPQKSFEIAKLSML